MILALTAGQEQLAAAVVGFLFIAIFGFMARMLWAGLRDSIVKAVLDSSLKEMFGGMAKNIDSIATDQTVIKTSQNTVAAQNVQTNVELNALRMRFDAHLDVANAVDEDYRLFKRTVQEFMLWVKRSIPNGA